LILMIRCEIEGRNLTAKPRASLEEGLLASPLNEYCSIV
jgi:hypothetical protein